MNHTIYNEMLQLAMRFIDSIEPKRFRFELHDDSGGFKSVIPGVKQLVPEKLGVIFQYVFKKEEYVYRTKIYLDDELFSEINTPLTVKEGFRLSANLFFPLGGGS